MSSYDDERPLISLEAEGKSAWPMAIFLSVFSLSVAACVVGSLWVLANAR